MSLRLLRQPQLSSMYVVGVHRVLYGVVIMCRGTHAMAEGVVLVVTVLLFFMWCFVHRLDTTTISYNPIPTNQ